MGVYGDPPQYELMGTPTQYMCVCGDPPQFEFMGTPPMSVHGDPAQYMGVCGDPPPQFVFMGTPPIYVCMGVYRRSACVHNPPKGPPSI